MTSPATCPMGRTPSGAEFAVPRTADMFAALRSPAHWRPAELLTLFLSALSLLSLLLRPVLPPAFYIAVFAFWRLAYNLVLAVLLRRQSDAHALTRWLRARSPAAHALLNWACTGAVLPPYAWADAPPEFNAWLAFRALCTVILANDGLSYFVLCVACNRPFAAASVPTLAFCVPAGLALLALSFWTKAKAHHALGDFAWFWGDFFFTLDGDLVFDGVFELFPHPMYTVGYAGYYGAALITRSYTVLLVSLLAHLAQLAFLALVEEPHIRKIYASPPPAKAPREAPAAPPNSLAPDLSPHAAFLATAPQPARDDAHADNLWMRSCIARGSTRTQAYSSWQHIFLFSYLTNHALFLIAALCLPATAAREAGAYSWVQGWALGLAGLSLIAVAVVSMVSAWSVTGYFGFFYGDFFVAPETRELTYKGSFRYVTNPELTLGYLAYYGLAIVRQSWSLVWLALLCQGLHMLFISCVEEANTEREYKLVRKHTALETSFRSLPGISFLIPLVKRIGIRILHAVQQRIDIRFETVSRKVAVQKEKMKADIDKAGTKIWEQHVQRCALELKTRAESRFGVLDCDKVISLLEKRGVAVRPIGANAAVLNVETVSPSRREVY
ncbi:Phosphatidylethanolamine N-methyltransferase [Chondrus crispus]|uniref:Phosphatidylethanolamine N-methyltransferase n=1 Tax=Chondrus crispus TaxID=2769 RepID=R7QMW6_CHOCR|nr:Phosphatidylethanolamine N-methyltransferase [Chondrus crispus]CDF38826.1 Phosphatidylethanolamine N-methyltransferase [Chondrus crispus]|eukprot:XP_005718731.1 Phosphatidylethanolamine N-methyltransferase [Chondrus crispus]